MSHIVTLQTRLRDRQAVDAACQRLRLPAPASGTARLYSGEATGLIVQLPEWQFPIVIDLQSGAVRYDNYEGRWGPPQHLDRLLQVYAVELTRLEARKQGYAVREQTLKDGTIKLQILTNSST